MTTRARVSKTVSIPRDLAVSLELSAASLGRPLSRIAEDALRTWWVVYEQQKIAEAIGATEEDFQEKSS